MNSEDDSDKPFVESPYRSPRSSGISVGTSIRIRSTDRIHQKLHQYANTNATVVDMPVHPNTWFGVRLHDQRKVKIRKSAFDVISKSENMPIPNALEFDDIQEEFVQSPRRRVSSDPSDEASQGKIVPGLDVTIIRNNDVMQKFPTLVGQLAEIIDIPRHPNTWYTVRIKSSGKIVKMRRSALKFDFDDDRADSDPEILDDFVIRGKGSSEGNSSKRYRLDSRSWMGAEVLIIKGSFKKHRGFVVGLRNNKLEVDIGGQDILKKISQIQIIRLASLKVQRPPSPPNLIGSYVSIEFGHRKGAIGLVSGKQDFKYLVELHNKAPIFQSVRDSPPQVIEKRSWELKILVSPSENDNFQSLYEKAHWIGQKVRVANGKYAGDIGSIQDFSHGAFKVLLQRNGEQMLKANDMELTYPDEKGNEKQIWKAATVLIDLMSSTGFSGHQGQEQTDGQTTAVGASPMFSSALAAYKRTMGPLKGSKDVPVQMDPVPVAEEFSS